MYKQVDKTKENRSRAAAGAAQKRGSAKSTLGFCSEQKPILQGEGRWNLGGEDKGAVMLKPKALGEIVSGWSLRGKPEEDSSFFDANTHDQIRKGEIIQRKLKWDNMESKEIEYTKAALGKNMKSNAYREIMSILESSDFVYTVNNTVINKGAWGDFHGVYDSVVFEEDEETGEYIPDLIKSDFPSGGRIGINFDLADMSYSSKEEWVETMQTHLLEEFIHAAQYDYYVHKYGRSTEKTQPVTNTEFEAKTLAGFIQSQAGYSPIVSKSNSIPMAFGRRLNSRGTMNNYQSSMEKWGEDPDTYSTYRNKSVSSAPPEFLLYHLKNK